MARRAANTEHEPVIAAAAQTSDLIGHQDAERILFEAWRARRLGHAWMLCGPRGIGKATLAYRLARFLLAGAGASSRAWAPDALRVAPDHPVFRRIAAGAHPDLFVLQRGVDEKGGRLRSEIVVDDVRAMGSFFAHTAADGGWRIAIVDPAEEMNRHAANAVLKILEEPPELALLLLVAHTPGRLPPTIRSRCRMLPLRPLADHQIDAFIAANAPQLSAADRAELVAIADGSPGLALAYLEHDGLEAKRDVDRLLASLPELDLVALHAFCERAGRTGQSDAAFKVATRLIENVLAGIVRSASGLSAGQDEAVARLGAAGRLEQWIEVWEKVAALVAGADSLRLDRKQILFSAFTAMRQASRG